MRLWLVVLLPLFLLGCDPQPAPGPAVESVVNYHTDHLGSTVFTTNEQGQVLERFRYEEQGRPERLSGEVAPRPEQKTAYLFTGHEYDQETGLYYAKARYLDGHNGRFISLDPKLFDGSRVKYGVAANHGYLYAENNFANSVDPDGEASMVSVMARLATRFAHFAEAVRSYRAAESDAQNVAQLTKGFSNVVKGEDYVARGGQKVTVDLESPNLIDIKNDFVKFVYDQTGISPPGKPLNRNQQVAVEKQWPKFANRLEDSNHDNYGASRNRIIERGGGVGDLGEILGCGAGVCRELSIGGSVMLSEFGIASTVVTGRVPGGRHAWIETSNGSIIDSNYTRSWHSDRADYIDNIGMAKGDTFTEVAHPALFNVNSNGGFSLLRSVLPESTP